MSPALAAALRLSSTLPVRTHRWEPDRNPACVHASKELAQARRESIRAWLQETPRPSIREMARRLGVEHGNVRHHIRAIEGE